MSSLDSSGDGQLDFEEFCQAFEHLVGKKDKVTSADYTDIGPDCVSTKI